MTPGKFGASLAEAKRLLKRRGLVRVEQTPRPGLSREFVGVMMTDDYVAIYDAATKNFDFDVLLLDESILQFSRYERSSGQVQLRYAFYQAPYDAPTYLEFLAENEETYEEVGEVYRDEYEQVLCEASLNRLAVAIRYDYSPGSHVAASHSLSHLHFGIGNEIRLPVSRILTPLGFVTLMISQVFPVHWQRMLRDASDRTVALRAKINCQLIPSPPLTPDDWAHWHL